MNGIKKDGKHHVRRISSSSESDLSDNNKENSSGSEESSSSDSEESGDEDASEQKKISSSEDEVDSEEEEEKQPRKKRKKGGVSDFFLNEAEVDDDDDELEDEEDENESNYDLLDNEKEEVGEVTARDLDSKRRAQNVWEFNNEDEIEEYYKNKYNDENSAAQRFGSGSEGLSEDILQQTLLPSVKDPNLWVLKCHLDEEKITALKLMRKSIAFSNAGKPLQIKSVIAPENIKGYIYIEAYKQTHVKEALEGIASLRIGQWKQEMVPIKQMVDVLRSVKDAPSIKSGAWVRIRRGAYKDDLAKVEYVNPSRSIATLKLMPRIDYSRLRGVLRETQNVNVKRKFQRPPQKLFDIEAIRAIGGEVTQDGDFLTFESNQYARRGLLYKKFPMSMILHDGVKPSISELQKFGENLSNIELAKFSKEGTEQNFAIGDNIVVVEGELINLMGKVTKVDGSKITMEPQHEDLVELEFEACELKKYFKQGDHVKVIRGHYEGETGLIIRVEENMIIVLSDLTVHELKVRGKDLTLCSDVTTGLDSFGQFQWGDLVDIDKGQTVGLIVRLEKENLQLLNTNGVVLNVKPQAVQKRFGNRRGMALDYDHNTIQVKDLVKVIDGPHAGRKGEIRQLYRTSVFLYSNTFPDNGGIFVCKPRHLVLEKGTMRVPVLSALGIPSTSKGLMSPRLTSPAHPSNGGIVMAGVSGEKRRFEGKGRGRGMSRTFNKDKGIIGKSIKIIKGPYKGHVGIVKDINESTYRVELHSKCQTIIVDKSRVSVVGDSSKPGSFSSYIRTPKWEGNTPKYGSQTPMYNSGSQTPMYNSGSQTPMYNSGSQTPMFNSGSQTPYYGGSTPRDGSMTPAWQSAWDPTVPNTPARSVESNNEDDDSFDPNSTSADPNSPSVDLNSPSGDPNSPSVDPYSPSVDPNSPSVDPNAPSVNYNPAYY